MDNENNLGAARNGLSSPANNSLQQSYYIAALSRYLRLSGLISPVTDVRDGIEYQFDFYNVETGSLIKVFTTLDEEQISKYQPLAADEGVLFILDTTAFEDCATECGAETFEGLPDSVFEAAERLDALIYFDKRLYECLDDVHDRDDWNPMLPFERQRLIAVIESID